MDIVKYGMSDLDIDTTARNLQIEIEKIIHGEHYELLLRLARANKALNWDLIETEKALDAWRVEVEVLRSDLERKKNDLKRLMLVISALKRVIFTLRKSN
ncbi:hypothetical protein ACFL3M_01845 [Patescibacteria group bacterium]